MLRTPWTLHEAEIALWPAWKDGTPYRGPGYARGTQSPLFACKASLTITETRTPSQPTGYQWTGTEAMGETSYEIACTFLDGAYADKYSRVMSRRHHGGLHILTARWLDPAKGEWTCLRFFYVTQSTDAVSDAQQVMTRSVSLRASWLQETVGTGGTIPTLAPELLGQIDWVCGAEKVTAYLYDPATATWTSTPQNLTGDGSRYVNLSPTSATPGSDLMLTAYLPRLLPESNQIEWQNTRLMRIGNQDSTFHHGLSFPGGGNLQAIGIPEPLHHLSQDRMLEEPVVVFRFLRRVYATFGHATFAIPSLILNEAPPASHDAAFQVAVPGAPNPATGRTGLLIHPDGAWLDGTVL